MRPRPRLLLGALGASLIGLALACGGGRETVSVIDVPLTLEDAHALEGPGVVVGQETVVKPPGGGGACGHTPLCVIVLPLMLVEHMFPDKHVELVVVTDGVETWRGAYTTGGELLHGRKRDGEVFRDVRVLELPELGQDLVLEVSSAPVASPDATHPTLIQGQVDLLQQYRDELALRGRPRERGRLLVEAWTWMGEESRPLLEAALPGEPDESQAEVVEAACRAEQLPEIRGLVPTPGPWTAGQLMACGEHSQELTEVLVTGACADEALAREAGRQLARGPGLDGLVGACPERFGRVRLQLELGLDPSDEDVQVLLTRPGALPSKLVERLDLEEDRDLFLGVALLGPNQDELLDRAARAGLAPTVEEAERLLKVFEEDEGLDLDRPGRKARCLQLLQQGDDDVRALAVERLRARASGDEASHAHAGLVLLGQDEHQLPAARGLGLIASPAPDLIDVVSPESLPAWALYQAGCTDEVSLRAARTQARAAPEGTLGRVCPG